MPKRVWLLPSVCSNLRKKFYLKYAEFRKAFAALPHSVLSRLAMLVAFTVHVGHVDDIPKRSDLYPALPLRLAVCVYTKITNYQRHPVSTSAQTFVKNPVRYIYLTMRLPCKKLSCKPQQNSRYHYTIDRTALYFPVE